MSDQEKVVLPECGYPQLVDIVKAYSDFGKDVIFPQKLHEILLQKMPAAQISRSSKFLASVGLIEGGKWNGYRVTPLGLQLGKAFTDNDPFTIARIWHKIVSEQVFLQKVMGTIKHNGSVDKGRLKKFIVTESGRTLKNKGQYDHAFSMYAVTLIEILKEAHLIAETSGGAINIRQENSASTFISLDRINDLYEVKSVFDCSRLIRYCEEINDNYEKGNYASVGFLARAIVDHVPPIFNQNSFSSVAAQIPGERHTSFKKSCDRLDKSLKNIVDRSIHKQIDAVSIPPFKEEIDFSNDLNTLLARVVEELKTTWRKND